jgi:hypothetical protein
MVFADKFVLAPSVLLSKAQKPATSLAPFRSQFTGPDSDAPRPRWRFTRPATTSAEELTSAEPTVILQSSKFDMVIDLNSAIMLVTCDTASTLLRGEEVIQ